MPDNRKTMEYLPSFMQEFREIKAIMSALQPELDLLAERCDQILDDAYIDTAGASAMERYENMLKIQRIEFSTSESRRKAIKALLYNTGNYTKNAVRKYLDGVVGEGCYILKISNYTLTVSLGLGVKSHQMEIVRYLEKIKPANLRLEVDYLFNTHAILRQYTHDELSGREYQGIREEEF